MTTEPVMQSLYVDLTNDPDAAAKPIHLGYRLGRNRLKELLSTLESAGIAHVAINLGEHVAKSADILSPQGAFSLIDDPAHFDIRVFKRKSISIHWELLFTRPLYETSDLHEQGRLLHRVAQLVDEGVLRSTANGPVRSLDAGTLEATHQELRAGTAIGKRVFSVSLD